MIEILYAGICHSDLHTVENHWGEAGFPLVPGHEIVGKVIKVGKNVNDFKPGDCAGIGCMVNSCGECCACDHDREQECKKVVLTYNAKNWDDNDEITQGGYSTCYVLNHRFAIKVKCDEEDLPKIPSLMCAGITTFSPIVQAGVKEKSIVFVAGLGGLGHMAAQYLKVIDCQVVAFDTRDREDLARAVDVKFAKIEDDGEIDESFNKKFDFGIITIPYKYDLKKYLRLLHCGGKLAIVGLPPYDECPGISIKDLILEFPGVELFGSLIGGIRETQECVDFSVAKGIYPIVHEIEPTGDAIDEAYREMRDGDVDGRFVIRMKDYDNPGSDWKDRTEDRGRPAITKHQKGGTPVEQYYSPPIEDLYIKAVDNYVNRDIGSAAFDPHDVLYVGKKSSDGKYEGIIWDGSDGKFYIRPQAGQLKADGTEYTMQDYIDATRWMPHDLGFILEDGNKYTGVVRTAYPYQEKNEDTYNDFVDTLKERGIDVDNGDYDYRRWFFDGDNYEKWQKEDAAAAKRAPVDRRWEWPHFPDDYKTQYHITYPGQDGKAWQQRKDGSWVYTPPKNHTRKDGTPYTEKDYIEYFENSGTPNDWLNINGKLI